MNLYALVNKPQKEELAIKANSRSQVPLNQATLWLEQLPYISFAHEIDEDELTLFLMNFGISLEEVV